MNEKKTVKEIRVIREKTIGRLSGEVKTINRVDMITRRIGKITFFVNLSLASFIMFYYNLILILEFPSTLRRLADRSGSPE